MNKEQRKQIAKREKQLESAKDMYLSGISPSDISRELELPLKDLGLLIFGPDRSGNDPECWYQEKVALPPESVTHYVKAKRYVISQAEAHLMSKLVKSAKKMSSPDSPDWELDDMDKASKIITSLDKMGRLERGEATEHVDVAVHGTTLRDIVNGQANQLEDIENVEYTEVTNDNSEKDNEESDENEANGAGEERANGEERATLKGIDITRTQVNV